MSVFAPLARAAAERGLQFLVIGGHAVVFHRYARTTEDADLLVCREDGAAWIELVRSIGYELFHDGGNFLQFSPTDPAGWRLDLMLVNRATFTKLFTAAQTATLDDVPVPMPSLEHLLALKLHALKHGGDKRVLKDFYDVMSLVRANRLDVRSESFRNLVRQYGTDGLYEKLVRACAD